MSGSEIEKKKKKKGGKEEKERRIKYYNKRFPGKGRKN